MSSGLSVATMLQTFFVIALLVALMPFNLSERKLPAFVGIIIITLCIGSGVIVSYFGIAFLAQYGYFIIGLPLYIVMYSFSKAKGWQFAFVVMTTLIFHRMASTILIILRVHFAGYTLTYFIITFVVFGLLLYGAKRIKPDFHKIIFSYGKEFGFLSILLLLLLTLVWIFNPIVNNNEIDHDILLIAGLLYITVIMLYLYIGISFRSFSRRLDAERNELALGQQMQTAQEHIKIMQSTRENATLYRHDLRRHILLIGEFLDNNNLTGLRNYLIYVQNDIDTMIPQSYCINEAANLIFTSFVAQAQKLGVHLSIDAQIPQSLSINNADLSTLLANALENALTATMNVNDGRVKMMKLNASMSDGKLLLLVQNPYSGIVQMEGGLPQSEDGKQGFGAKSMESIAQKYDGLLSFDTQDGVFTVRLVI